VGRDERASGIARESDNISRHILQQKSTKDIKEAIRVYPYMLLDTLSEHLYDVMPFRISSSEAFCPSDEHSVVNLVLPYIQSIG
jgi:hypothetical protein